MLTVYSHAQSMHMFVHWCMCLYACVLTDASVKMWASDHLFLHQFHEINRTLAFQTSRRLLLTRKGQRKESSLTTSAWPHACHLGGSLLNGRKGQLNIPGHY